MELLIHIPKPCEANWDNMIAETQGRHCAQCSKTVIDFTGWDVNDIANYINKNAESGVCGRFALTQLDQDYLKEETYLYNVLRSGIHYMKQIAAVIVFVFVLTGSSCNSVPDGEVTSTSETHLLGDTVAVPQRIMGAPLAMPHKIKGDTMNKNSEQSGNAILAPLNMNDSAQ